MDQLTTHTTSDYHCIDPLTIQTTSDYHCIEPIDYTYYLRLSLHWTHRLHKLPQTITVLDPLTTQTTPDYHCIEPIDYTKYLILLQKIHHLRYLQMHFQCACASNSADNNKRTLRHHTHTTLHVPESLARTRPFFPPLCAAECTCVFDGLLVLHNPGLSDFISDSSVRQDVRAY